VSTFLAIDRQSVVPLYYQIRQRLLEKMEAGGFKPGQALLSEQEISDQFGVSRMTARQALKSLCDAGLAYAQRGKGTFASGIKQEKSSHYLLSFTEEMKARGSRVRSKVLLFRSEPATVEAAQILHLAPGEKVIRLRRVRFADSLPMALENVCLPFRMFPGLLETFDPRTSLYQTLADRYGARMFAADEVVEAGLPNRQEARLLEITKTNPVYQFTRTSYLKTGQPVEYVRSIYRGDRYKIVNRLTQSHKTNRLERR